MRDLKAIAASIEGRFGGIDARFSSVDDRLGRVEQAILEIKTLFAATLPHLATKADIVKHAPN